MAISTYRPPGRSIYAAEAALKADGVPWRPTMFDIVAIVIAVGFFAVSIAYVYACDRL